MQIDSSNRFPEKQHIQLDYQTDTTGPMLTDESPSYGINRHSFMSADSPTEHNFGLETQHTEMYQPDPQLLEAYQRSKLKKVKRSKLKARRKA